MAPTIKSRQLLIWTIPSIAILLSFLWYKRKRGIRDNPQRDPGKLIEIETKVIDENSDVKENNISEDKKIPEKPVRSLSGVESSPIDIIIPDSLRSTKTPPIIISDKDLDIEIAKVKSMKSPFLESTSRKRVRSALSLELEKAKTPTKSPNSPKVDSISDTTIITTPATPTTPTTTNITTATDTTNVEMKVSEMKEKSTKNSKKQRSKQPKPNKKITEKATVKSVAEKLSSIKLQEDKIESETVNNQKNVSQSVGGASDRQSSERDSANHSPADVMLASPSLSSISDNHSEGSSDSGKGCSDVATPAGGGSLSGDLPQDQITVYEFVIPQQLVGRLIGRHGIVVQQIKNKTGANILIKRHPESTKLKICAIEGTQKEIDSALKLIRQKFPEKRYPSVTLEQVHIVLPPPTCTLIPECIYLKLVEGINNDTIVSHVESPIHMFLHLHTHPSFPSLSRLLECMNLTYADPNSPLLPKPIKEGSICAVPLNDNWYRAAILSTNEEQETSLVQFVDFGGYCNVENSTLRQIRADFITLPFQAAECILANLRLKTEETSSTTPAEHAIQIIDMLTRGYILQTQIVGYTEEKIPLVFIYVVMGPGNIIFLNREIAEQDLAEWVEEIKV